MGKINSDGNGTNAPHILALWYNSPGSIQRSHVARNGRAPVRPALGHWRHREADRRIGGTMRIHTFLTSLICIATLSFGASAAVRPEINRLLKDSLNFAQAHNYKAAQARVDAANAIANKSTEEQNGIDQVRAYLTFKTTQPIQPCKGTACDF
jgi:hypothetical protein